MAAKECAIEVMNECGMFESTAPEDAETLKYYRVINEGLNYVCRDHVEGTQSFLVSRPPRANAGLMTVSLSYATSTHCPRSRVRY